MNTKSLTLSVVTLMGIFMFWACSSPDYGPKETGEKFLKAMQEMDWGTAKSLATSTAKEELKKMEQAANLLGGAAGGQEKAELEIGDLEMEEGADNAVLNYKQDGMKKTLKLVKEDGKWRAAFSKMGGMMDAMESGLGESANKLGKTAKNTGEYAEEKVGETLDDAMNEAMETLDSASKAMVDEVTETMEKTLSTDEN